MGSIAGTLSILVLRIEVEVLGRQVELPTEASEESRGEDIVLSDPEHQGERVGQILPLQVGEIDRSARAEHGKPEGTDRDPVIPPHHFYELAQREAPRRSGQVAASGGSQFDVGEDLEGALTEGEGFSGDGLRLFVHRPIAPWGPGQVGEGNPPLLGADEEVADQDTLQLIEEVIPGTGLSGDIVLQALGDPPPLFLEQNYLDLQLCHREIIAYPGLDENVSGQGEVLGTENLV
ncbi:MAG TPA: hypothetical protein VGM86_10385 [Thermoanaerobaculia bacterium]